MPASSNDTLSPSIVGAIRRFGRVVIVAAVVASLIALIYTALSGTVYAGKAGIVIAQPPTNVTPFFGASSRQSPAGYLAQQVSLLTSQEVSDGAAKIVNQKIDTAHLSGSEVHSSLTVKPQSGTGAAANTSTQVVVTMGDPEIAAASADAVVKAYLDVSHQQIRAQANQSVASLDKEIARTTAQLNGLPAHTSTNTNSNTGSSPTTPTTTPIIRPPRTTTTRPPRATTTRPPRTTTTHAPSTTTTSTTVATTAQFGRTDVQLAAYDSSVPSRLAAVVVVPTTTTTTLPGTTPTTTPSTTGSTPLTNSQYAQRAALTATLINLSRSKSQLLVDEEADLAYQPTVTPATVPTSPSNGNYLRNFILGGLIGLVLGVIAAYALAYYRRRFEFAGEPEVLYRVPLLAAVPAFQHPLWLPTGLPVLSDPAEEPAESIRAATTALRAMRGDDESLMVALSAASARSGTTTMVANLGLALVEMGESVLVIDGDPIGRGLTSSLTDTNRDQPLPRPRKGFSEVIGGCPLMETIVPADVNQRLSVLTSGQDPNLAIHRWNPRSIRLALNDALAHFDFVLLDVPPVGSSSYGIDLVVAAENLVLVVPYLDPLAHHDGLPDRLDVTGSRLLGYIFNGSPASLGFSPYFPILHSVANQPSQLPPNPGAPGPLPATVPSHAAVPTPAHAHGGDVETGEDITGVVQVIQHDDPITEQAPASPSDDQAATRQGPIVRPDEQT